MNRIILCGSKKYKNINFDQLVDSFDVIVRHNWLSGIHGYGKKPADIQVLNEHMYNHWVEKDYNLNKIKSYYNSYGHNEDTIVPFKKYLLKCDKVEKYFLHSRRVIDNLNLTGGFGKGPRCGISSILKYVELGLKPYLIGYSLTLQEFHKHATNKINNLQRSAIHHSSEDEIALIKVLHLRGLIDASFCTIEDLESIKLDSKILPITASSKEILKKNE